MGCGLQMAKRQHSISLSFLLFRFAIVILGSMLPSFENLWCSVLLGIAGTILAAYFETAIGDKILPIIPLECGIRFLENYFNFSSIPIISGIISGIISIIILTSILLSNKNLHYNLGTPLLRFFFIFFNLRFSSLLYFHRPNHIFTKYSHCFPFASLIKGRE